MSSKKLNKMYYFSVEGYTEQWYLLWLRDKINESSDARYKVSFRCKINKNPLKYAKGLPITGKTVIYHLCDYESDELCHVKGFTDVINNMKEAKNIGKQIDYKFGYSNLTFDLWIVLHKNICNGAITDRDNYLAALNKEYGENFENMDKYKREDNFKRILGKLSLSDVIFAINRAKDIMHENKKNDYILHEYKGYKYYKENPSLMIWEAIEEILKDCELI